MTAVYDITWCTAVTSHGTPYRKSTHCRSHMIRTTHKCVRRADCSYGRHLERLNFIRQDFDICLHSCCVDLSSPLISTICVGHFTRETYSLCNSEILKEGHRTTGHRLFLSALGPVVRCPYLCTSARFSANNFRTNCAEQCRNSGLRSSRTGDRAHRADHSGGTTCLTLLV